MRIQKLGLCVALCAAEGVWGQEPTFEGPNILSRGTRPIGRTGGRPIRLGGFAGLGVSYFGGLTRAATDQAGNFRDDTGYAGNVNFGIYGSKSNRRSSTSGSYYGSANLFASTNYYSGINQGASINHSQQISRRWGGFVGASASMQSTVLGNSLVPFSQSVIETPFVGTNEVFDSRTYFLSGGGGLHYQKSARLTFSMSGGAFTARRKAAALIDGDSFYASGEMSYQVNRKSSVGVSYSFGTAFFRRSYGESYFQTWAFNFHRTLNRSWSFTGSAGAYRVESDRLQSVPIDPLLARLTGQSTGLIAVHQVNYGTSVSAGLRGVYRTSTIHFGYSRGVNPGNGLYLTSQAEQAMVQYSYTGIRRLGLWASASWNHLNPILRTFDRQTGYESYGGGVGTSYRLVSFVHFQASAQLYRSTLGSVSNFGRDRYYVSAGISFSPGEVPLILW